MPWRVQNTPTITTIPCGELGQELCCSSLVGTAGAINCQGWVPRTRSCPWSVSPCLFLWQECSGEQPQGRDWELWQRWELLGWIQGEIQEGIIAV